jgi:sugar lactone lactonase YvrE
MRALKESIEGLGAIQTSEVVRALRDPFAHSHSRSHSHKHVCACIPLTRPGSSTRPALPEDAIGVPDFDCVPSFLSALNLSVYHTHTYLHTYIYICMYVLYRPHTHTYIHTHTHTHARAHPSQPCRNYGALREPRRMVAQPGDGVGQTRGPFGMCENGSGGLLVCDFGNHRLQEIFLDDRPARVVATYSQSKGAVAVTRLGDNYAVVDAAHQLRVLRADGSLVTTLGSKGAGPTNLNCPFDVRVLPSGSLVVSDQLNNRLQIVEPSGARFERVLPLSAVELNHPRGLAVGPDGSIYVVDHANDRVVVLAPDGVFLRELITGPDRRALERPFSVAIDAQGTALVADWGNSRIVAFPAAAPAQAFPTPGHPRSITIDSDGNVFVALEEGQIIMY